MNIKLGHLLGWLCFCIFISTSTSSWAVSHWDDVLYPDPIVDNGKKIYLSPARHPASVVDDECPSLVGNENTSAYTSALAIANGIGPVSSGLLSQGFTVMIGRGTLQRAIDNSNDWGADIHIPIHSNARPEACDNSDKSKHGAVVIYRSDSGKELSEYILSYIRSKTPGTKDFVCHESSSCTDLPSLGELRLTKAVAAYIEREFHSWNQGAKYLNGTTDSIPIADALGEYLTPIGRPDWWSLWNWWSTWGWAGR